MVFLYPLNWVYLILKAIAKPILIFTIKSQIVYAQVTAYITTNPLCV
jgi:hypothetical protein